MRDPFQPDVSLQLFCLLLDAGRKEREGEGEEGI